MGRREWWRRRSFEAWAANFVQFIPFVIAIAFVRSILVSGKRRGSAAEAGRTCVVDGGLRCASTFASTTVDGSAEPSKVCTDLMHVFSASDSYSSAYIQ